MSYTTQNEAGQETGLAQEEKVTGKRNKGIYVWNEMLDDSRLDGDEVLLLAVYKWYTDKMGNCTLGTDRIIELLGGESRVSRERFLEMKRKLKGLNLIMTKGYVTWYLGYMDYGHDDSEETCKYATGTDSLIRGGGLE